MKFRPKHALQTIIIILLVGITAIASAQFSEDYSLEQAHLAVAQQPQRVVEPKGSEGEAVYLVELSEPSLALWSDTANSHSQLEANESILAIDDAPSYLRQLEKQQELLVEDMSRALAIEIRPIMSYKMTLNAVAVRLSPEQAATVAGLKDVKQVVRDVTFELMTDAGPAWVGAPAVWDGSALFDDVGSFGEGVVVGVLDSGINTDHPSFGEVDANGFAFSAPTQFFGWCDPIHPNYDPTIACNNKLIGVYSYPTSGNNPEDDDSHGSHTASTVAGNFVDAVLAAPTTELVSRISGVAPHAQIIAFDVCEGSSCSLSAILLGIDDAVAAGVDVINYSIGSPEPTENAWESLTATAFLGAVSAGTTVVTSAGNSGPTAETVGSPADLPWMLTVGGSTHPRELKNGLVNLQSDGGPLTDMFGLGLTAGYGPAPIIYAGDVDNPNDPTNDPALCLQPYPAGTFNGEIVVCDRGRIARTMKGRNVLAGGAGGLVLANTSLNEEAIAADAHELPAVHIGEMAGDLLRDWLETNSGEMATITGVTINTSADNADVMADFSSRGPNRALDILKPDLTAPGVDIWAAYANGDAPFHPEYGLLSGTSMASPHVAGAAALLKSLNPNWSPAEIKSALMLSAETENLRKEDGIIPADLFDVGAGRLDVAAAANAGLLLDITAADYLAANPQEEGDLLNLNLPSLQNAVCLDACSWVRTVSNATQQTVTWQTALQLPPNVTGSVTPSTFSLAPDATQTLTITLDAATALKGEWLFGRMTFEANPETKLAPLQLPIAIISSGGSFAEHIDIETRRAVGQVTETGFGLEIEQFSAETFGFSSAITDTFQLAEDSTQIDPYDNLEEVYFTLIDVPKESQRFVFEILSTTADDLDLYWGIDTNGNLQPDLGEELGRSRTAESAEYVNINHPADGLYWVLVQNWDGVQVADRVTLGWGIVRDNNANIEITAPITNPAGVPFEFMVGWHDASLMPGTYYAGFSMGTTATETDDLASLITVDLDYLGPDVAKTVEQEQVTVNTILDFTVVISPNDWFADDLTYVLSETLPASMSYVPNSARANFGTITQFDNGFAWTGIQEAAFARERFEITTNHTSNSCFIPLGDGGYYDLLTLNNFPTDPAIEGDQIAFAFDSQNATEFFGKLNAQPPQFTDDGLMTWGALDLTAAVPHGLPNPQPPNDLVALYWRDWTIDYDPIANAGVTAATGATIYVVEYDNVTAKDDANISADFQVVMFREPNPQEGFNDIFLAYDNVTVSDNIGIVGVEDNLGERGYMVANNDFEPSNDLVICFDWIEDKVGADTEVVITYQAYINQAACDTFPPEPILTQVQHNVDATGFAPLTAELLLEIDACEPTDVSLAQFSGGQTASLGWLVLVGWLCAGLAGMLVWRRHSIQKATS